MSSEKLKQMMRSRFFWSRFKAILLLLPKPTDFNGWANSNGIDKNRFKSIRLRRTNPNIRESRLILDLFESVCSIKDLKDIKKWNFEQEDYE